MIFNKKQIHNFLSARSLKTRILFFILPIVVVGIMILPLAISKFIVDYSYNQITSYAEEDVKETAQFIDLWIKERIMESTDEANWMELELQASSTENVFNKESMDISNKARFITKQQFYEDLYDSAGGAKLDGSGMISTYSAKGAQTLYYGNEQWYKDALADKRDSFVTTPYIDKATGKTVCSALSFVNDPKGSRVGIATSTFTLDAIFDWVKTTRFNNMGFRFLVDANGNYLVKPDLQNRLENNIFEEGNSDVQNVVQKVLSGEPGFTEITRRNGDKMFWFYHPIFSTNWTLVIAIYTDEVVSPANHIVALLFIFLIVLMVIIAIGIVVAVKRGMRPLSKVLRQIDLIATHDLRPPDDLTEHGKDELGRVSQALDTMRRESSRSMHTIQQASGELTSASEQMNAMTEQNLKTSKQAVESLSNVTKSATRQMERITSTTAAIDLMNDKIKQLVQNADEISKRSSEQVNEIAMQEEKTLNELIGFNKEISSTSVEATQLIKALSNRSQAIRQVVDSITATAEQTTLLSLNAAIEAARAGAAGRSFAVVAEEVRKLAEASTASADNIVTILEEVGLGIDQAAAAIEKNEATVQAGAANIANIEKSMQQIYELVKDILEGVQTVSQNIAAMETEGQEINRHIAVIDMASHDAAQEAEMVLASIEEQAASMQEIDHFSQTLSKMAGKFSNIVKQFKL